MKAGGPEFPVPSLQRRGCGAEGDAGVVARELSFGVSDHPGAPSLEAAPYRACAVAPPLLRKEGNGIRIFLQATHSRVNATERIDRNWIFEPANGNLAFGMKIEMRIIPYRITDCF